MKKTLIFSAALIALAFTACTKEKQTEEPAADPTYRVATEQETSYELTFGKQKTVEFDIRSANGGVVGANIDVTVFADESKVAEYNLGKERPAVLLPSSAYNFSGTTLRIYKNNKKSISESVKVTMLYELPDTLFVLPINISKIEGSTAAKAADNATLFLVFDKKKTTIDKGDGTKAKPYLIYDKNDLWDMHEELLSETEATDGCTYFKMMQDVDLEMKPVGTTEADTLNWEPLNWTGTYDKKIDFNGDGHTIKNLVSQDQKYASFCGVVYGEIYNVTFENSYIKGTAAIGTIGGYCGSNSANIRGLIKNVHVVNGQVVTDHTANGAGGIVGRLFGTIDACSFEGTITDGKYAGGIAGFDDGKVKADNPKYSDTDYVKSRASKISNCYTAGVFKVPNGGQRIGGILGDMCCAYMEISNCFVKMGISGNMCVGGIAAHVNWDQGSALDAPKFQKVSKCIAWCDSLTARNNGTANYSCGAICGFCAPTNICEDCYRKSDLVFYGKDQAATDMFAFFDQPNSNSSAPQTTGVNCDYKTVFKSPYNGKAAAAGKTASEIAADLGWDTTIWDLTGSEPKLKK